MYKIILASASPRRQMLLEQIGLDFEVIPSDVDECYDGIIDPAEIAMTLSRKKALQVLDSLYCKQPVNESTNDEVIVIAADTLVVNDDILGKPNDIHHARNMLLKLSGAWHRVITGITVVKSGNNVQTITDYECTKVKMKKCSEKNIDLYLDSGEYKGKAGAYAIQGKGSVLVEKIEGCYFNVVGLPISKLADILLTFGINVLLPM